MLELDEWERAFFVENRKLTTDSAGNEMMVGLTLAESLEYLRYVRDMTPGKGADTDAADRYLELHEKHELARKTVLFAEIDARNDTSPRH
jgi:hypothetical protein